MLGYKDDEMTVRWVQLGIYSPIMRLHSSSSEFNGKEPWRYKKEAEMVMDHMLRERHRMIPYLYTMNYRSYCENKPLISPMYYNWQECNEAYEKKNQYLFGTSLMVAPITAPRIEKINMAKVQVWLPKGRWYDIYTGMIYDGDRILDLYRGIESIPFLLPQEVFLRLQTKSVQCRHRKIQIPYISWSMQGKMVSLSCMKTTMCPVHMRRESVVQRRWCIVKMKNQSLQYIRLQEIGT